MRCACGWSCGRASGTSRSASPNNILFVWLFLDAGLYADTEDGLRDGEHIRHAMQQRFRDTLAATEAPWVEVRGSVAERVDESLAFLDGLPAG